MPELAPPADEVFVPRLTLGKRMTRWPAYLASFTLRLPPEHLAQLREAAENEGVSASQFVRDLLERELIRRRRGQP